MLIKYISQIVTLMLIDAHINLAHILAKQLQYIRKIQTIHCLLANKITHLVLQRVLTGKKS